MTDELVVFAPATLQGQRCILYLRSPLDRNGRRIATSSNERARVAQMLGALHVLHAHAAVHGFTTV